VRELGRAVKALDRHYATGGHHARTQSVGGWMGRVAASFLDAPEVDGAEASEGRPVVCCAGLAALLDR
jgi:hypothetical protein